MDIVIASTALLCLSPVLLATALAIAAESSSPVLFRQKRGGFRGQCFRIFKFRSMRTMEDGRNLQQALRDDPRVTRLGAFLRRTSLDELPQLLNVLKGDMSLVGPRPHAVCHDNSFARTDDQYRRRQLARPGITGLAQVRGARGQAETSEQVRTRLAYDLAYIENWSVLLDIKIMIATAALVLRDRNAY